LKWTNQYQEDTDLYLQFINDCTEKTNDDDDKIHLSELYKHFKEWFYTYNPNTKIPNNKIFINSLRKHEDELGEMKPVRIDNKSNIGVRKRIILD
jgi:phage/plasmid-associated DNA primase